MWISRVLLPLAAVLGGRHGAGRPAREVRSETGVPVISAPRNQFGSAATTDGAGGAIFAWMDDRDHANVYDLYVQRLDAAGAAQWNPQGVVVSVATLHVSGQLVGKRNPVLVPDGAGGAIVAWHDNRDLQQDVYAQRVSANGTVLWQTNGVPVGAACWPSICNNQKGGLQIASDGAGGAILTWHEIRDGFNFSVWAQRIRPDGTPAWTVNGVPVAVGSFYADFPKIAPDGAGGAFISWQKAITGDIYAQHVNATGAPVWVVNGIQVGDMLAARGELGHQVIADGSGGAIFTWVDGRKGNGNDSDLYAQRLAADGTALWMAGGFPVCTRTGHQYSPS